MKGYTIVIGQYQDELKSDDARKRLNAIEHLLDIAKALGNDRTKNELWPFLRELLDDEEENLCALAKSLYEQVKFIGGNEAIKLAFLNYEFLFGNEDSSVRNISLEYIEKLVNENGIKDDELYSMAKRLSNSDNHAARNSATMLYCKQSNNFSSSKYKEMLSHLNNSVSSDIPIVRKTTAIYLKFLLKQVTKLESETISLQKAQIKDDLDTVKIFAIESLMAKSYENKTFMNVIWPIIKPCFEENSWRVKYTLVANIGDIVASTGKENTKKMILPYYAKFLVDNEYELKNIAAKNIRIIVKYLESDDIINKIVPIIKSIVSDEHAYVRASLASSQLSLAPVLGKKATNEHILGFFLTLQRDDSPDVRINIFKTFHELTQVLPATTLIQSVLPVFQDLGNDKNWHVRAQTVETLQQFEKELGEDFINDKAILKLLVDRLQDKVFGVREATINTIKKMCQKSGSSWCEKQAQPLIMNFQTNPNYLYRLNYCFGLSALAGFLNASALAKVQSAILSMAGDDKVPNVRYNAIKTIRELQKNVKDRNFDEKAKKVYKDLSSDKDRDVSQIATKFQNS